MNVIEHQTLAPELTELDLSLSVTTEQRDFLNRVAKHMRCTVGELVFSAAMARLTTNWGMGSDNQSIITETTLEDIRRFIDQRDNDFDVWFAFDKEGEQ